MSASLVGSEMCIRDRRSSRSVAAPRRCGVEAAGSTRAPHGDLPAGVGPVSYTHLTLPTICSV
eukprot:3066567-Alexandrium_andersonii.AAC.1